MARIPDKQIADLIEKANDPTQFATLPGDKAIVTRTSFQMLLANLAEAREECADRTAWMDIATELADDLRDFMKLDNFSDAPEGSPLHKFHLMAVGIGE